ncbi:MAG: hypothetical protein J0647_00675 [Campylobacteraceae bacterium]|nr:hypothetical protein [Campylobacteraceae bacterium]
MNTETLSIALIILALGIGYAIFQINTIKNYFVLVDEALATYEKNFATHQKTIKALSDKLSDYEKNLSSIRHSISLQTETLKEKIATLEERWEILADERITSIPKNNKEWFDAKQITQQPIQKTWKAPKNSQTKQSLIKASHESDEEDDSDGDGTNQDFSEMDNTNFEKLLNTKSHGNKNIYHPSKSSARSPY